MSGHQCVFEVSIFLCFYDILIKFLNFDSVLFFVFAVCFVFVYFVPY
jgi:hypothetical protein